MKLTKQQQEQKKLWLAQAKKEVKNFLINNHTYNTPRLRSVKIEFMRDTPTMEKITMQAVDTYKSLFTGEKTQDIYNIVYEGRGMISVSVQ